MKLSREKLLESQEKRARELALIAADLINKTSAMFIQVDMNSFHAREVHRKRESLTAKILKLAGTKIDWMNAASPCRCGRNHFAIAIAVEETVIFECPVSLYMRMANIALRRGGIQEWASENPISSMVRRFNKEEDAYEYRM